jgi:hypothetical protein
MNIFNSDLKFTLDSYSHLGSLTFQSRMTKSFPIRTVLTFRDARAFEIQHISEGLVVDAEESEQFLSSRPTLRAVFEPGLNCYMLRTKTWEGYIVAGAFYHEETKVMFTNYESR